MRECSICGTEVRPAFYLTLGAGTYHPYCAFRNPVKLPPGVRVPLLFRIFTRSSS